MSAADTPITDPKKFTWFNARRAAVTTRERESKYKVDSERAEAFVAILRKVREGLTQSGDVVSIPKDDRIWSFKSCFKNYLRTRQTEVSSDSPELVGTNTPSGLDSGYEMLFELQTGEQVERLGVDIVIHFRKDQKELVKSLEFTISIDEAREREDLVSLLDRMTTGSMEPSRESGSEESGTHNSVFGKAAEDLASTLLGSSQAPSNNTTATSCEVPTLSAPTSTLGGSRKWWRGAK
jgi:hypothetical protein